MTEKWNNAPPRNLIILVCAIGSALLLVFAKFGFDAYYDGMTAWTVEQQQTRYDDLEPVRATHAEWNGQLDQGNRMSIGDAMEQLGERGRNGFPAIRPQAGDMNVGPLEGWNQLPQEVVRPEVEPAPSARGGLSPEAIQQLEEALRGAVRRPGAPD